VANWPAVPQGRYLAREEALSIATHGFIGCYGYVRRMNMKSLFCRGGTDSVALTLTWHYPFRASVFHVTHNYDLMSSTKISAHATEWGPAKVLPIGPRTCEGRPWHRYTKQPSSHSSI